MSEARAAITDWLSPDSERDWTNLKAYYLAHTAPGAAFLTISVDVAPDETGHYRTWAHLRLGGVLSGVTCLAVSDSYREAHRLARMLRKEIPS